MCGRYTLTLSADAIAALLPGPWDPDDLALFNGPSVQVAPTDPAPIAVQKHGHPGIVLGAFGLPAPWDSRRRLLNARVETADTLPAFREAWRGRRAVVPASGWLEWSGGAAKRPWHLMATDGSPLVFAALFAEGRSIPAPSQTSLLPVARATPKLTFCILTRPAPRGLDRIHDRMPVVLPANLVQPWLECSVSSADLQSCPAAPISLVARPVDPAVGNPRARALHLLHPTSSETIPWEG